MNRCFSILWLALAATLAVGDESSPADGAATESEAFLRELERGMSSIRTIQADFRQEKKLALFNQMIVIEGHISLENPGKFAWHARKPIRYSLVINGSDVRQWDEDTREVQRLPVSRNPIFKMATGQLRDWFAGRYTALRDEYELTILSRKPCTLRFVPKKDSLAAKAIQAVEIRLRDDLRYLEKLRIEDRSGDHTTIHFHNTVLNKTVDPSAWEVAPRD